MNTYLIKQTVSGKTVSMYIYATSISNAIEIARKEEHYEGIIFYTKTFHNKKLTFNNN